MLFFRRKRQEELARREAEGETFWTKKFDESIRTKIVLAFNDAGGDYLDHYSTFARHLIRQDVGLLFLTNPNLSDTQDLFNYVLSCRDEMVPTAIEAMAAALRDTQIPYVAVMWPALEPFQATVATALREHRISYDLIGGEMIGFSSRELHEAVMVPTLRLLAGRRDLGNVETAYREALDQIAKGKSGNAITDAGTALQETLLALGCDGNALGPLIKSARSRGILAPHDSPLLDAIEKAMHWVSADRSEMGDAHSATDPTVEDAWLIVHVVGALVLRLAQGRPRGRAS